MRSIMVDFSEDAIRTALVEDGSLKEIIIDDYENNMSLGNIFLGIVKNILPSKFAFIDIGSERNVFLNLNDSKERAFVVNDKPQLKQGQKILVQLLKDAAVDKSEVVTTQLAFSDRNAVLYINSDNEIGVSKKIKNRKERARLKNLASKLLPEGYGIIVRTNAKNMTEEEISESVASLRKRAENIQKKSKHAQAPLLVYKEEFFIGNTLKELFSPDIDEIVINSKKYLEDISDLIEKMGGDIGIIKLHGGKESVFTESLEKQIRRIMVNRVWLKSGGFIIIEQTEACVVIDVNTGKNTGSKDFVLKTNLEAAVVIAAELRIRNLSGLIIIDFINMREAADKALLRKTLGDELKKDRIAVNIAGMTRLGLMQLTRKKTRRPVLELLTNECPFCNGSGRVFLNADDDKESFTK